MVIIRYLKALLFDFRVKRAIRKAQQDAALYRKKFLVLLVKGRPVVVSKQGVRRLIARRMFQKGFTAAKAEAIALFVARPPQAFAHVSNPGRL